MKKIFAVLILVFAVMIGSSCSSGGGGVIPDAPSAPSSPDNLSSSGTTTNSVSLSWTPVSGATSYTVYWSLASGLTVSTGTAIPGILDTSYTHSELVIGTTYYYLVTAFNAAGESLPSIEFSVTTMAPPAAPTGVIATAYDSAAGVSWTGSVSATSYNLYWSESSPVTIGGIGVTKVSGVTSTSIVSSLTNSTTYYFAVSAVNLAGEGSLSTEASAMPRLTVPAAPTNVVAMAGDATVSVSWTASSSATSYNLYWSTTQANVTNENGAGANIITGVTSTYVHGSRTNLTPYYYAVTAVNAAGESVLSEAAAATPIATGATSYPFLTNFEDGTLNGWTATGEWAVTTESTHTGTYSVTDSPNANYAQGSTSTLTSPLLDLSTTTKPMLTFWHRYNLGVFNGITNNTSSMLRISSNGGPFVVLATYKGSLDSFTQFTQVSFDLSSYKTSNVQLRFEMHADPFAATQYDGWYIDDIVVSAN